MRPELPAPLAPWAAQLALFDGEIATALGPSLGRLASAIGPLRSAVSGDASHFDGFGGIARRGSYERLLLSEWLLADEMPDEFLRRAASMEHGFLDLERKAAVHARASFALFDAGPSQIGAPRVAHVAALVVLARRAAAAGAGFHWGVLQSEESPLHAGLSRANVRELLEARTARGFVPAMVESWRRRIAPLAGKGPPDVWIVGGESATDAAPSAEAGALRVEDRIGPDLRSLLVVVTPRRAPRREVDLALPAERLVSRLLRDPFSSAEPARAPRPAPVDASERIVLSPSGRKAFVRTSGGLLRFPIPNSSRAGLGASKRLVAPGGTVAAVTISERRPIVLVADPKRRTLALRGLVDGEVGHFTTEPKVHAPWVPLPSDPLARLYVGRGRRVYYLDSRQWLFSLDVERGFNRLVARDVRAITTLHDAIAFVTSDLRPTLAGDAAVTKQTVLVVLRADDDVTAVTIGDCGAARLAWGIDGPMCAAQRHDGTWDKIRGEGPKRFATRASAEYVVGVLPGDDDALLVRDAAGGPLRFVTTEADVILHPSLPSNASISLDERGTVIAFVDASRRLTFFSLPRREIVGRYPLGGPP